jgi:hypothetical protein
MLQPAPKAEADESEFETFDQYLKAEFLVSANGKTTMTTITKRARDNDVNVFGKSNTNPLLDTCEYECTVED